VSLLSSPLRGEDKGEGVLLLPLTLTLSRQSFNGKTRGERMGCRKRDDN